MTVPTREYLRDILHYDAESGAFTWLKPPKNHSRMVGKPAGCSATGYILIRIDGKKYKAHHLAWVYMHGVWPRYFLDHRDVNPLNNAIANLREATSAQNGANKFLRAGKHLPKGVRRSGKRFMARISYEKRQICLGTFDTPAEASAAYFREARRLYGEFARIG
jgi:hypothetical protein